MMVSVFAIRPHGITWWGRIDVVFHVPVMNVNEYGHAATRGWDNITMGRTFLADPTRWG